MWWLFMGRRRRRNKQKKEHHHHQTPIIINGKKPLFDVNDYVINSDKEVGRVVSCNIYNKTILVLFKNGQSQSFSQDGKKMILEKEITLFPINGV